MLAHALHTFPSFPIGVACFLLLIFFKEYYLLEMLVFSLFALTMFVFFDIHKYSHIYII